MAAVPQPPITDHTITVPPRRDGVGLSVNTWRRQPRGTVIHSMGGTLRGTDGYFQSPSCPALTDYGIGQTDHGGGYAQIIRWNDMHGFIEGWASGPVRQPEGDGPRFLAAWGGAEKLNEVGISLEHDDTTLATGKTVAPGGAPVTAFQWAASVWLQAYLHAEVLGQTAGTYDWNMHHLEFCGRAYKTCPNPRITDHTAAYQEAVKAVMRHFQEGVPYPAGGVVINGLRIAVPGGGSGIVTPPEAPGAPGPTPPYVRAYINQRGEAVTEINWGGVAERVDGYVITDDGIAVVNAAGETWDRSVTPAGFGEWRKRP